MAASGASSATATGAPISGGRGVETGVIRQGGVDGGKGVGGGGCSSGGVGGSGPGAGRGAGSNGPSSGLVLQPHRYSIGG